MRSTGKEAEAMAQDYLIQHGLVPIEKNYHCRAGEIDLIMKENETLVFIEVKYRTNLTHGTPVEMIQASKQRKLLIAAKNYLHRRNAWNQPCRIDALGIHPSPDGEITYTWIKNAIQDS